MSEELVLIAPQIVVPSETVMPPLPEAPLPGTSLEMPQPEQIQAVDGVFTRQQDEEAQFVAGLIGLWTATLLLRDLTVEHLSGPVDEEKPRRKFQRDEERDSEGVA
jgi:hypothetical protein